LNKNRTAFVLPQITRLINRPFAFPPRQFRSLRDYARQIDLRSLRIRPRHSRVNSNPILKVRLKQTRQSALGWFALWALLACPLFVIPAMPRGSSEAQGENPNMNKDIKQK
jgi:hypothetical protein